MDEIGGGQGKVAFDRAYPSVTQKRPLVSHIPTARWVALGHENESTGLRESGKRHWKTRATPRTPVSRISPNVIFTGRSIIGATSPLGLEITPYRWRTSLTSADYTHRARPAVKCAPFDLWQSLEDQDQSAVLLSF
jgi:hypothetical protein